MISTVMEAYLNPFTTQSNFARNNANQVAMAACEGLITTKIIGDVYCSVWRVTPDGLDFINNLSERSEWLQVELDD